MTENKNIKPDEFGCNLYIDTAEDHPSTFDELLSIKATDIIVKNTPKTHPRTKEVIEGAVNNHNLWIYKIEKQYAQSGIYLNKSIEIMLSIMDNDKTVFHDILRRYPKNHLLCYAYFFDVNPYFKFDKALIERLNYYNIDLEFDIYCLTD
ncbi:DUF4279 domain-containing protein [Mucilaginibacter sp. AW1-3]